MKMIMIKLDVMYRRRRQRWFDYWDTLSKRSTMKIFLVVVIVSSWSLQRFVSADDVFASSAHLRLLADGEQRLVDALTNGITAERRRLLQLDQLDTISISYLGRG